MISEYLELVKKVGLELKSLLCSVDSLVPIFPTVAHKEVSIFSLCYTKFQSSETIRGRALRGFRKQENEIIFLLLHFLQPIVV